MARKIGKGPAKTNAARALDRLKIRYDLHVFSTSDQHMSAAEVAESIGQPLERVFKTLVTRGNLTGPLFVVIPSHVEVDFKAVARASGNRTVSLVPLKEVTLLTGYVRGGTTALAAKKPFPVFLDVSAQTLPEILISAGLRGQQLRLSPADYMRATGAQLAPIGVVRSRTNE